MRKDWVLSVSADRLWQREILSFVNVEHIFMQATMLVAEKIIHCLQQLTAKWFFRLKVLKVVNLSV